MNGLLFQKMKETCVWKRSLSTKFLNNLLFVLRLQKKRNRRGRLAFSVGSVEAFPEECQWKVYIAVIQIVVSLRVFEETYHQQFVLK